MSDIFKEVDEEVRRSDRSAQPGEARRNYSDRLLGGPRDYFFSVGFSSAAVIERLQTRSVVGVFASCAAIVVPCGSELVNQAEAVQNPIGDRPMGGTVQMR